MTLVALAAALSCLLNKVSMNYIVTSTSKKYRMIDIMKLLNLSEKSVSLVYFILQECIKHKCQSTLPHI